MKHAYGQINAMLSMLTAILRAFR